VVSFIEALLEVLILEKSSLLFKSMEYRSYRLTTRYNTAIYTVGVDSLADTTIHFKDLHER
jgi:hypothetical protein